MFDTLLITRHKLTFYHAVRKETVKLLKKIFEVRSFLFADFYEVSKKIKFMRRYKRKILSIFQDDNLSCDDSNRLLCKLTINIPDLIALIVSSIC